MALDRRTLFKRSLIGGVVLAVGGSSILALRQGTYRDESPNPLSVLDPVGFAILVSVVRRLTPATGDDSLLVAWEIDQALTLSPERSQRDFVRALFLLENALTGLFFRRSTDPFTALPPELQDRALMSWRDSRLDTLRGAYHALRRLSLATYYARAERGEDVGYPGPPFSKPEAAPIRSRGPLSPPYVPRPPAPRAPPAPADEVKL